VTIREDAPTFVVPNDDETVDVPTFVDPDAMLLPALLAFDAKLESKVCLFCA
jgi:hypothetical protein